MRNVLGIVVSMFLLASCRVLSDEARVADAPAAVEETETVTPATEPEPAAEEVDELQFSEEEARTVVFPVVFESSRTGFIEIIRDLSSIESVDSYVYEPETGTVLLDVTSELRSEDYIRDDAWELTRLFGAGAYSRLNSANAWLLDESRFVPALKVTVSSGVAYECDGETMHLLGAVKLSRTEWEATCRIR